MDLSEWISEYLELPSIVGNAAYITRKIMVFPAMCWLLYLLFSLFLDSRVYRKWRIYRFLMGDKAKPPETAEERAKRYDEREAKKAAEEEAGMEKLRQRIRERASRAEQIERERAERDKDPWKWP